MTDPERQARANEIEALQNIDALETLLDELQLSEGGERRQYRLDPTRALRCFRYAIGSPTIRNPVSFVRSKWASGFDPGSRPAPKPAPVAGAFGELPPHAPPHPINVAHARAVGSPMLEWMLANGGDDSGVEHDAQTCPECRANLSVYALELSLEYEFGSEWRLITDASDRYAAGLDAIDELYPWRLTADERNARGIKWPQ